MVIKEKANQFSLACFLVLVSTFLFSTSVFANSGGITGHSGKSNVNCSSCHSGANYRSSLTYNADTTVEPGSTIDVSLVLQFTPPSGVNSPFAGVNVALSDNGGTLVAGSDTLLTQNELIHRGRQATSNNSHTWSFQYTAPATEGNVTLYACSLTVNGDFSNNGDDLFPACVEQVITVAASEPDPEPTPDPDPEPTPDPEPAEKRTEFDFDGDGKADVAVRRPSTFFQYVKNSGDDEIQRIQFGRNENDIPVSGDFDGDGKADVAVRRPSNQLWYIKNSSDGEIQRINFGLQSEDIPVPADYDGDGTTDVAVRRLSTKFWYIKNSSDAEIQRIQFGMQEEDIPVPADYDGDGKADVAVRRPSNQMWYIKNSSDGEIQRIKFGLQSEDIPVPADYDGDGKADVAVRRPSNQMWYIKNSSDGEIQRVNFGLQSEDIPVPADYDGDGKADVAVRRPSNQMWYIKNSSDGEIQRIKFGLQAQDIPLSAPVSQIMKMLEASSEEASSDHSLVAVIKSPANVKVDDFVNLDGRLSTDANRHAIVLYKWSLENLPTGSQAALDSDSVPTPSFVADVEGTYTLTLVVSDGISHSEMKTVEITVGAPEFKFQ